MKSVNGSLFQLKYFSIYNPGNDVLEIRLRALKSVELQFKVYDHLNFNGPFLMKALIKWFDFDSICEETLVLQLILNILKVYS